MAATLADLAVSTRSTSDRLHRCSTTQRGRPVIRVVTVTRAACQSARFPQRSMSAARGTARSRREPVKVDPHTESGLASAQR
jgi:antitoxin (DNA-binding transcriptional repressor) of toxin-antitoxin stability system